MTDILAIKKGDPKAFRGFVNETHGNIYSLAFRFLQNKDDAEDITQEVFLEVYKSIHKFKEKSDVKTWMYRITVNKSLNLIKKEKKNRKLLNINLPENDEQSPLIQLKADRGHEAEFHLENNELKKILLDALNRLPERQKIAFILHNYEAQSYQSVASILQISLSSVESLIFRARTNLKKNLAVFYKKNYL